MSNFELRTLKISDGIFRDRLCYAIVFHTQKDRQEFIQKRVEPIKDTDWYCLGGAVDDSINDD